jgi:nucleoside-diphosphate-sugar epimerase
LNLSVKYDSKTEDFQPERDGLKGILEAARKTNVRRIAYCSSLVQRYQGMNGFRCWMFDVKQKAIEMIKQSGIPYTIFYPSSFMENFDQGGYKQGGKMQLAGESRFPMWFIAGSDYGKQVARAFQLPEAADRDYDVQGPEALTGDEAVKIFVENYPKEKLTVSKAPMFVLKLAGLFNRQMSNTAKIIEALNNYPEKFNSEKTWAELGEPTVTLAEYARKA